jgi:MFS family permease
VEILGQGWLVLQMTDSPFWVGVAAGIRGSVEVIFSIVGGAWADRFDHRKLLIWTQVATAILALGLALLVFMDLAQLWHVLLIVAAGGSLVAIGQPASRALEFDVVGAQRILNASALRFLGGSIVQIAAALAGGFIIDKIGVEGNYALSSGAVVVAAGLLLFLRVQTVHKRREPFITAIRAGLGYSLRTPRVRQLLLLSLMVECFGFSYLYMMPVVARDILAVGPTGLGYLMAMMGVGQLIAMLVLASLGDPRRKGFLLFASTFSFGLFIVFFGLSPWFSVSLALVAVLAGSAAIYDSAMATLLQIAVSSDMRGRVMGLYVSTWGLNQVGGFGLGGIGTLLSVPVALAISGGVIAVTALRLVRFVRRFDT